MSQSTDPWPPLINWASLRHAATSTTTCPVPFLPGKSSCDHLRFKRCRIEMLGFRRMFFGVAADLIAALVAFATVAVLFRKASYASSGMGFEASLHRFDPCLIFLAFPLFTLFLGFGRCDFCLFHPFRFRESIHSAIPLSTTSPPHRSGTHHPFGPQSRWSELLSAGFQARGLREISRLRINAR